MISSHLYRALPALALLCAAAYGEPLTIEGDPACYKRGYKPTDVQVGPGPVNTTLVGATEV